MPTPEDAADEGTQKQARHQPIGKVEEALGWATGDRRVEAEGHLRHEKAAKEGPGATIDDAEVDLEQERVRREHGDTR